MRTEERHRVSWRLCVGLTPAKGPVMSEATVLRTKQFYERLGEKIALRSVAAGWIHRAAKRGRVCFWRLDDVLAVEARIALGDLPQMLASEIAGLERARARKAAAGKTPSKFDAVSPAGQANFPAPSHTQVGVGGKVPPERHPPCVLAQGASTQLGCEVAAPAAMKKGGVS